jgi:hypothetical protein
MCGRDADGCVRAGWLLHGSFGGPVNCFLCSLLPLGRIIRRPFLSGVWLVDTYAHTHYPSTKHYEGMDGSLWMMTSQPAFANS